MSDPGGRQVKQNGTAEPPGADNENVSGFQALLTRATNFGQQDVTGIPRQFLFI
jgi:hypothetical protein